jgi:broad specificity phosphatase PhoE
LATITLVRHGQASFGSENYDALSELGKKQAGWLGEHWCETGRDIDLLVIGSQNRHWQTANEFLDKAKTTTAVLKDPGLDEYNFSGLLDALKSLHPDRWQISENPRRDYYYNIKLALSCWIEGSIMSDGRDSWKSFCDRVKSAFHNAVNDGSRNTVLVTSGGPIAVVLQELLNLDSKRCIDMMLQIKNSSASTVLYNRKDFTLDSFNDVSHLLLGNRLHAITFS